MTNFPRLAAAARAEQGGGRILVVDDDEAVLRSPARLLTRAGFETFQAPTAAEAVTTLATQTPPIDVLLSDVVMPEMTGIELAAAVADAHPKVEVLLVSGFTPAALTRHDMTSDRAPKILQKPLARGELIEAVTDAVERARSRQ